MNDPFHNLPADSPAEERVVRAFLKKQGEERLRKRYAGKLATHYSIAAPEPPVRKLKAYRWPALLTAAATVALVVAVSVLLYQRPSPLDAALDRELALTHYSPPQNRSWTPGTAATALLADYKAGRYRRVTAREARLMTPEELLYVAMAHAQLKEYRDARSVLSTFSNNSPYIDEANWYKAVFDLKLGNLARARQYLKSIPADDPSYYRPARQLLSMLADS